MINALQRVHGGQYQGKRDAVRFEDLTESFLTSVTPTVRESTVSGYKTVIDRHLLPAFQGRRVGDITMKDVEQLRANLLKKAQVVEKAGGPAWIRTRDQRIMSPLL